MRAGSGYLPGSAESPEHLQGPSEASHQPTGQGALPRKRGPAQSCLGLSAPFGGSGASRPLLGGETMEVHRNVGVGIKGFQTFTPAVKGCLQVTGCTLQGTEAHVVNPTRRGWSLLGVACPLAVSASLWQCFQGVLNSSMFRTQCVIFLSQSGACLGPSMGDWQQRLNAQDHNPGVWAALLCTALSPRRRLIHLRVLKVLCPAPHWHPAGVLVCSTVCSCLNSYSNG